ncbi:MAG: DUF6602 domain-containing protein [Candidatus Moraniibacteriota bacterium]
MNKDFDINLYLNHIARELISNYSFAGDATTPALVGGAREREIRKKLSSFLPSSVGIGTGCVIDSYGNTSNQIDIVIYEKQLCPVFSINDSPETTYFPCEGVIAVGEVKSTLNGDELEDIFKKINSVKSLERFANPSKNKLTNELSVSFRNYGNSISWDATKSEEFDQKNKRTDQIFGFAFCGNVDLKPQTLLDKYCTLLKSFEKCNTPNLISILNYGLVLYMNRKLNEIRYWPGDDADSIYITSKRENNFQFLLARLTEVIRSYRTVELSVFASRYISPSVGDILLDGTFKKID